MNAPPSTTIAPTDPPGLLLQSSAGPVHITDEGRGPAVLCVHGIPGSVRDFRYIAPALCARGFRVVRVDLPGFGGTPRATFPRPGLEDRALFLKEVARGLSLSRFFVLGHSMGTAPALLCAALFPDAVRGLVLINSVGVHRHQAMPPIPRPLWRAMVGASRLPVVGPRLLASARAGYKRLGFKEVLDDETITHHMRLIAAFDLAKLRFAARTLRCPVLLASSADDPLIEPRVPFALARALSPEARQVHLHFRSGGHHLQKHRADAIARHAAESLGAV